MDFLFIDNLSFDKGARVNSIVVVAACRTIVWLSCGVDWVARMEVLQRHPCCKTLIGQEDYNFHREGSPRPL